MNKGVVYFPGLNGLRAISAIAVVISHTTLNLNEFNLDPKIFGVSQDGRPLGLSLAGYGVSIFFVLSGFLITYLLQTEKDSSAINVKNFYIRRILRIWPLYYLFLIIVLILACIHGFEIKSSSLLFYIFYAANVPFMMNTALPFLSHYWSLGAEEQFYLFWPWINKKIRSLVLLLIISTTTIIAIKVILHFAVPNSFIESAIDVTGFHCMMIGALGAALYKNNHRWFLRIVDNMIAQIICWIIILLVAINVYHLASVVDNEIISVVALFLIIGQIRIRNRIINLELFVFDFLGKISYGIYVIHPIIIFTYSKILCNVDIEAPYKYFLVYLVVLSSTVIVSYLSYNFFEKYFLSLKKRFTVVKSSGSGF